MGKLDVATRKFMKDPERFADVFNFYLYGGRPVINHKQLQEMDTTEDILINSGGSEKSIQRYRDIIKKMTVMTDGKTAFRFLAIENASKVYYAEVIKDMLYDAVNYAVQVQEIAKAHKKAGDYGQDSGEFLSGFHKGDKLVLVITLVLYYGASPWDGPRSLKEMLNTDDPVLLQYAQDYKLNLIVPHELTDSDFGKFSTDFGAVLNYIKYSKDDDAVDEMVHRDERFRRMMPDAFSVINIATNSKLTPVMKEGKVDMCEAIEKMVAKGEKRGEIRGEMRGEKRGEKRSREQTALKMLENGEPLKKIRLYSGLTTAAIQRKAQEHGLTVVA